MNRSRTFLHPTIRIGAVALLILFVSLVAVGPAATQGTPHRVGLVVQFPDRTVTTCVTFDEPEISGYEVLARSGLNFNADLTSNMGAAICSIEDVGCTYPVQDCFCQCQGGDCLYWSYWHLRDGEWEYSQLGAGNYTVRDGDVEGWRWGQGEINLSAQPPPVYTFDELCAAPTPTDTPVPVQITFTADDQEIDEGQCTWIRWQVQGAQQVFLDGEVVSPSGNRQVCPAISTSYRLQIQHATGELERLISVNVRPSATQPTPTFTTAFQGTSPLPTPTPTTALHTTSPLPTPTVAPTPTPPSTPTFTPTPTEEASPTPVAESSPTPAVPTPTPLPAEGEEMEPQATPTTKTITTMPLSAGGAEASPTAPPEEAQPTRGDTTAGQRPEAVSSRVTRSEVLRLLAFGLVGIFSAAALGAISLFLRRREG